jgi:hypothetical protein
MCQHLHCLPSPGGLLDQDSFMVYGMDLVVDAQGIKQDLESNSAEAKRKSESMRR